MSDENYDSGVDTDTTTNTEKADKTDNKDHKDTKDTKKPTTNNNNKTTKGEQKKGPTKEEIQKSIERKKWVDRVVTVLLVIALSIYFIFLIIAMVSSANSKLVETEDVEEEMTIPFTFIEFVSEIESSSGNEPVIDCTLDLSINSESKLSGTYNGQTFTVSTQVDGWNYVNLAEYAADSEYQFTGLIITPPEDNNQVAISRNVQNYIEFSCSDANTTVYVNLYYEGQYDQYDERAEEVESISYDAYECKLSFDTNFDLLWSTIIDELAFASKPEELDGIDGAYNYYEMELSGVYPLSGAGKNMRGIATYAGYRKHTKYTYQDATTFFDVVAAIGGMYTSLASIIAWFTVKFLWGYDFRLYKWTGFAPYAPRTEKKEGEKDEEEETGGED